MLGDLGLQEVLPEAQAQDLVRALVEDPGHPLEHDARFDAVELGVGGADQVTGAGRVALLLAHGGVERADRPALAGLERLDDLLLRAVDVLGEVGDGRGPAELGPQLLARLLDHQAQLLEVARRPHVPRGVAEVAADLAEDRRHRVAREREPAVRVPAVHGLDEAHRGDLNEVVERLRSAAVAQGEAASERHVALDQLFTRARVPAAVAAHQPLVVPLAPLALRREGGVRHHGTPYPADEATRASACPFPYVVARPDVKRTRAPRG